MKVCVLGLGEVGLAVAKYAIDRHLEVYGYDVNLSAITKAREKGLLESTNNWHKIPPTDVYLICVSTGLKGENPDLFPIFDVCEKINEKVNSSRSSPSPLVSIESTIIPGLCKEIYTKVFKKSVNLVHTPHRYWSGNPNQYGVKQLRVIGGMDSESLNAGLRFYKDVLGIPLCPVSSIEVAEMSKIAENAYRYVQIAFAEELRMMCEELKLNFSEVQEACNTKWNIKILEARDGIKGHCIPKDAKYLVSITTSNILTKNALVVDKKYREWLSHKNRKTN